MKKIIVFLICAASAISFAQFRALGAAKEQQCMSNLKQLGLGIMMILYDGNQPPQSLEELKSYNSGLVTTCPQKNKKYIYLGYLNGRNKSDIPVVIDAIGNHPGKINVLWADGHVSTLSHKAANYQGLLGYFKGLTAAQKIELLKALKKADAGK